jgi:hypothetical protein
VPDVAVTLAAPGAPPPSPQGIGLYLYQLAPASPTGNTRRLPLQLSLRYLVTAWAETPAEAHRLLGALVFAAMENPEFEVDLEPLSAADWAAFGATPQPSFVLRVPLRHVRPEPDTARVRKPLVVRATPLTSLQGIVLTPDDVPLMNARVALPLLQRAETTDAHGRFRFDAVPVEPRTKTLTVTARGMTAQFAVEQPGPEQEWVEIRFAPKEE